MYWFYSERKDQKNKSEQIESQKQKRMAKLEKEIGEWKELLDLGEIDEATYNEETNRLIEKERKRTERMRRFQFGVTSKNGELNGNNNYNYSINEFNDEFNNYSFDEVINSNE